MNDMTLYDLCEAELELEEYLERADEDPEAEDLFEQILAKIDNKIEAICKILRNTEARAEMFKAEKARLASRQSALNNRAERLKQYILFAMQRLGHKKIDVGTFSISRSASKSVAITHLSQLPEAFLEPQPPKPLKTEIAKALKAGKEVPGAMLCDNEFLRIR